MHRHLHRRCACGSSWHAVRSWIELLALALRDLVRRGARRWAGDCHLSGGFLSRRRPATAYIAEHRADWLDSGVVDADSAGWIAALCSKKVGTGYRDGVRHSGLSANAHEARRARAEYALELLTHVAKMFDGEGWTERQIAEHLGWHLSADEYGTPRRSARVQGYVAHGRELRRQEKESA